MQFDANFKVSLLPQIEAGVGPVVTMFTVVVHDLVVDLLDVLPQAALEGEAFVAQVTRVASLLLQGTPVMSSDQKSFSKYFIVASIINFCKTYAIN